MNYLQWGLMPLLSLVVMFCMCKIIGYRQVSQLSHFDYINGITIGSIASEVAVSPWDKVGRPLTALIVFGIFTTVMAVVNNKSLAARKVITGKPIVLMERGVFYGKAFSKAKLDMNEFLTECRTQGYFDVSQIDTAILEPKGTISILPKSQEKPVTPKDIKIVTQQETIRVNVIMDGKFVEENMNFLGVDREKIGEKLKELKISREDVYLATCDTNGKFDCFTKEKIGKSVIDSGVYL